MKMKKLVTKSLKLKKVKKEKVAALEIKEIPPIIKIKKEHKKITEAKKKPNYVDPKAFEDSIQSFYKTNVYSRELGEAIYNIANRIGFNSNFINYSYKEEMVGDAIIKMFTALKNKNFDPKLGKPFAYFSQIAFNAFKSRIKKEKKAHEVLRGYQEEVYSRLEDEGYVPRRKKSDGDNTEGMENNSEDND